jgi:hypothetical protein
MSFFKRSNTFVSTSLNQSIYPSIDDEKDKTTSDAVAQALNTVADAQHKETQIPGSDNPSAKERDSSESKGPLETTRGEDDVFVQIKREQSETITLASDDQREMSPPQIGINSPRYIPTTPVISRIQSEEPESKRHRLARYVATTMTDHNISKIIEMLKNPNAVVMSVENYKKVADDKGNVVILDYSQKPKEDEEEQEDKEPGQVSEDAYIPHDWLIINEEYGKDLPATEAKFILAWSKTDFLTHVIWMTDHKSNGVPYPYIIEISDYSELVQIEQRIAEVFVCERRKPRFIFKINRFNLKIANADYRNATTIKELNVAPPNYGTLKLCIEQEEHHYQYADRWFEKVFTFLCLLSNYMIAKNLVDFTLKVNHDILIHVLQPLINYMRMRPTYYHANPDATYVFDLAFRYLSFMGSSALEHAVRATTAGIGEPEEPLGETAKRWGLAQLAPRYIPSISLNEVLDNIKVYSSKIQDGNVLHLDAAYNTMTYLNQLITRVDDVKMEFWPEYIDEVARLVISGTNIFGIDTPVRLSENRGGPSSPRTIEVGAWEIYLQPKNVTRRFKWDAKHESVLTPSCLICGWSHFTSEHAQKKIVIQRNMQQLRGTFPFRPRDVTPFTPPAEVIEANIWSTPILTTRDETVQFRQHKPTINRSFNGKTAYADIVKSGRMRKNEEKTRTTSNSSPEQPEAGPSRINREKRYSHRGSNKPYVLGSRYNDIKKYEEKKSKGKRREYRDD